MKSIDWFLLAIVGAVVLLVVVAFVVVLLRPGPEYHLGDSPEAVAHNYLLALQMGDYIRAHEQLSPDLSGYPVSPEVLFEDLQSRSQYGMLDDNSITLEVLSSRVTGDYALVTIRETRFIQGGLFFSDQSTRTFEMSLRRANNRWKIVKSDSYWSRCWDDREYFYCP